MKKGHILLATGAALALTLGLAACGTSGAPESSSSASSNQSSSSAAAASSSESSDSSSSAAKTEDDGSVYVWTKTVSYDENGNVTFTDERALDEKGNVTKVTTTIFDSEEGSEDRTDSTVVSEHLNINEYGYPSSIKSPNSETTYKYTTEDGKLIEEATFESDVDKDETPLITTYEFYENGGIKTKIEESGKSTITTNYDENGYVQSTKAVSDVPYEVSYSWTFDASGNPTDYTKTVKNDGSDDSIKFLVKTDANGNIISINDEKGQPIYTFEYQKISNPSLAAIADSFEKRS